MTSVGDNTWQAEVTLVKGNELKVRADGKWDDSWGNNEGGNIVVEADGKYLVKIVFANGVGTVTLYPAN